MHPSPASSARVDVRLVPAALTCWAVTAAGIWWPIGRAVAACCVVLFATSGAVAWRVARRPRATGWLRAVSAGMVAVGVVGAGYGLAVALRSEAVGRHPITVAFGTAAAVTVTPTESPVSLGRGRLLFRVTLQRLGDAEISGRVVVFARTSEFGADTGTLVVGRPVRFTARISRPTRRDLTVAVLNATGRPTAGTASAVQRAAHTVRARFSASVRQALPTEQAAMLPALVIGDTSAVTVEIDRDFRAAGMTHLMAVSGANVTIVCAAVLFSARWVGPRAAVVLAALTLAAFVVVVQPTASVLRAAVMGAIGLAGMLSSRRRQAVPALSATVLVLLAIAPQLAVDVGFALSVMATAALVVIAPAWSRGLAARGCPRPLADALAIAVAAHVVTAPLVAGISGRFSLVAIAANLAAAPVIAPITVLGSAAAVLSVWWPSGAQMLIRFTGPELWWVVRVAEWSAAAPAATVPVPSGVPGVLVVGGVTVVLVVATRVRGRRWLRVPLGLAVLSGAVCALAWGLSTLLDPTGA